MNPEAAAWSLAPLAAVVEHYVKVRKLQLSDGQKKPLREYLNTL